ncbi:MAG TPA: NFACT RNA binding domain-containing protein [Ignavibacteriales bacterium]|nr:NFACT RNA binding domain-containing protein [Ignavibacteriales bacterium]
MYRNYFILSRYIKELNKLLVGSKILNAFSFKKDILNITLIKSSQFFTLEFSVNSGFPYIRIIDNEIKPKNFVKVFEELQNTIINNITISNSDRIIKFEINNYNLFFTIRGKYTNVYLLSSSFTSFKKEEDDFLFQFHKELLNHNFVNDLSFKIPTENNLNNDELVNLIRFKYSFISKDILNFTKHIYNEISLTNILKVIEKIYSSNLVIIKNRSSVIYTIKDFALVEGQIYEFNNVKDAINYFVKETYLQNDFNILYKNVDKFIKNELSKISNLLNKLKSLLETPSKEDYYRQIANLLLINLHKIQKGKEEIELENIYDNSTIKIKLNPKYTPKDNVDYYFKKQKEEKKLREVTKEKLLKLTKEYESLQNNLQKLEKISNYELLKDFAKQFNIRTVKVENNKPNKTDKFRHFIINNRYHLYLGKDNETNDLLTIKYARPNDIWLHVKDAPSAHGILRKDSLKENIPLKVLEKAASIIAYNSKQKGSTLVPVICTSKKYISKNKHMEPGQVKVLKEEIVLLVKPSLDVN